MATMKKPIVHDDVNNTLTPITDGHVLEPSVIPVSAVEGNVVQLEEDGLAVTPSSLVSEDAANLLTVQDNKLLVEPQTIVSEDTGNVVSKGSDGGAFISQTDFENAVNQLIEEQVGGITVVSEDTGNVISKGSDGGAYINQEDFVNEVNGMIDAKIAEADHVSTDEGNLLRNGSDGLAFADGNDLLSNGDVNLLTINEVDKKIILTKDAILKQVASDLVSDDDAILKAVDGQIVSEVCINYEPLTGTLQLTGVDGEIVCETTVPSQATALKSVEFVTTKPETDGGSVSGTYIVTVQLRDILLGWLEPVTMNIEATKGSPTDVVFEIDGGGTCGGLPSGMVNARAWFNGQESDIYAGAMSMSFAFTDSSVLSFPSYKLNEEGTGYILTGSFTPAVGVASGAWLHFLFELTDGGISELYVDVSYLIDVYTAGEGIDITNNIVSVDGEWLKTQVEQLAPEYTAGTGIIIEEHTVAVDEDWLDEKLSQVTAEVNAGDGILVGENNTVSVKAGTGIIVDENGVSVDETALNPVSADAGNVIVEGSDNKAYFPADWGTME